jgi:conjugal transfer pilin signal peptidase TrbI
MSLDGASLSNLPATEGKKSRFWRWFKGYLKFQMLSTLFCAALIAFGLWLTGIRIGIDVQRLIGEPACMPSLVYLWKPGMHQPPKVGDYVLVKMPNSGLSVGARPGDRILKKVYALEGDTIKVEGTELWINGTHTDRLWLAKSLPGKKPGDFDAEYILKDGQMFLMGTTQESFDSRYWGVVNREAFLGYAIPLF